MLGCPLDGQRTPVEKHEHRFRATFHNLFQKALLGFGQANVQPVAAAETGNVHGHFFAFEPGRKAQRQDDDFGPFSESQCLPDAGAFGTGPDQLQVRSVLRVRFGAAELDQDRDRASFLQADALVHHFSLVVFVAAHDFSPVQDNPKTLEAVRSDRVVARLGGKQKALPASAERFLAKIGEGGIDGGSETQFGFNPLQNRFSLEIPVVEVGGFESGLRLR